MGEKEPKVGMPVQYFPFAQDQCATSNGNTGPVAAVITRVWGPEMVNLMILPDCHPPYSRTSIHKGDGATAGTWNFIE